MLSFFSFFFLAQFSISFWVGQLQQRNPLKSLKGCWVIQDLCGALSGPGGGAVTLDFFAHVSSHAVRCQSHRHPSVLLLWLSGLDCLHGQIMEQWAPGHRHVQGPSFYIAEVFDSLEQHYQPWLYCHWLKAAPELQGKETIPQIKIEIRKINSKLIMGRYM